MERRESLRFALQFHYTAIGERTLHARGVRHERAHHDAGGVADRGRMRTKDRVRILVLAGEQASELRARYGHDRARGGRRLGRSLRRSCFLRRLLRRLLVRHSYSLIVVRPPGRRSASVISPLPRRPCGGSRRTAAAPIRTAQCRSHRSSPRAARDTPCRSSRPKMPSPSTTGNANFVVVSPELARSQPKFAPIASRSPTRARA